MNPCGDCGGKLKISYCPDCGFFWECMDCNNSSNDHEPTKEQAIEWANRINLKEPEVEK